MWRAKGHLSEQSLEHKSLTNTKLITQGFITAVANPKGWAFMIAVLPPFISIGKPISLQLATLVVIIMCSEFLSMLAYASGGKSLRLLLNRGNNARWMNRIAGTLLGGVGFWLALS
jgi:threonine/homoserine/homoserine lactone efflux protein